jgi:hypothetical protein
MNRIFCLIGFVLLASTAFGLEMPDSLRVIVPIDSTMNSIGLVPNELADSFEEGLLSSPNQNDSTLQKIDFARSVLDKIRKGANFIKSIDANSKFELPVGISKTIAGINYDVGIYAVRLKPLYAELDVVMQIEIPQNGKQLTFMGSGIKLCYPSISWRLWD